MNRFYLIIGLILLAGCTMAPPVGDAYTNSNPDVLTVKNDGTMVFHQREISRNDVVIYNDGFGGQKAAVRVYVPFRNDFFRDSIVVHREDANTGDKETRIQ